MGDNGPRPAEDPPLPTDPTVGEPGAGVGGWRGCTPRRASLLLPWIVYLAVTLPRRQFDRHYRAAWVGFDLILVFAIARTAYMAFRFDPRVQFPATATAVLLLVDAWFDVTTSSGRSQFLEAVLLAVLVEVPSALFSSIWPTR